ncbi:MAG: pyridoxamine 5'-phosphate oxidase family protein [Opitutales bacterium]|nr:pyridoxamine 5'-phosphate oxidase family protein [Opitutales bacterium]
MGKRFDSISESHRAFIEEQKMFFVGTADRFGTINVSPKGLDSFRVLSPTQVAWLNLTGSGNESAAHVFNHDRMTIMFCSFLEKPLILRLYGKAQVFHGKEKEWDELITLFPRDPGNRQIFLLNVDLVQTSCGFGVPLYDYIGDRSTLRDWSGRKGEEGMRKYWAEKNTTTIDGVGTRIEKLKDL